MAGTVAKVMVASAMAGAAAVAWAQMPGMQPGQWEIAQTTTAIDMPGAPPAIANMMKGRTVTIKHCVTPQEVAEGPQGAMKRAKGCTINYRAGPGGTYTSQMVCRQGASTTTASSSGRMTGTSFTGTTRLVTTGGQAMTLTSTATGRRVGDCKG